RSGHRGEAPGRPHRQPCPAAGREHHPADPPQHRAAVRPPAARHAQRGLGPPDHHHAAPAQRACAAGRAEAPDRRERLAARAGTDPRKAGRVVSEHSERTTAAPGPPGATGPRDAPGSVSSPGHPDPASPSGTSGSVGPPGAPSSVSSPGPPTAATSPQASGTDAQRARRPRRPHPITISTTAWLILAVIIVTGAFLISEQTPWLRVGDRANTWVLRLIAEVRTPWLTDVADAIKAAGSSWAVTVIGLSVVVLCMIFRRWRHLLVFLGSFFFLGIVTDWIYSGLTRPRPYGITILSRWGGYSAP